MDRETNEADDDLVVYRAPPSTQVNLSAGATGTGAPAPSPTVTTAENIRGILTNPLRMSSHSTVHSHHRVEEEFSHSGANSPSTRSTTTVTSTSTLPLSLSPSLLVRSPARVWLLCTFVALISTNLLLCLSANDTTGDCGSLWWYLLSQSFMFVVVLVIYRGVCVEWKRVDESQGELTAVLPSSSVAAIVQQSIARLPAALRDRLSVMGGLLLLLYLILCASTVHSILALSALADDACHKNRAMRQLVLFDAILTLSLHTLVLLYFLLSKFLPKPYVKKISKSWYKSIVMLICICACVANIAQLTSHDEGGLESYHWSFTSRPTPCPFDCQFPPPPISNVRQLVCVNSAGEIADQAFCDKTQYFHYSRPERLNPMLQPCHSFSCRHVFNSTANRGRALLQATEAETQDSTEAEAPPPTDESIATRDSNASPNPAEGARDEGAESSPNAPASNKQVGIGDSDTTVPVPTTAPSTDSQSSTTNPIVTNSVDVQPPYTMPKSDPDCPRECVSYPRDYSYPGEFDRQIIDIGCWSEAEVLRKREAGEDATQGWVDMSQCKALPEQNFRECPPRPCPEFCGPLSSSSLLYIYLYLGAILLLLFSLFFVRISRTAAYQRVSTTLGVDRWSDERVGSDAARPTEDSLRCSALVDAVRTHGLRALKPWWRHLLFIFAALLLLLLVIHCLRNLMWLVESHCRDFLLSAILNSVTTFTLALFLLAGICQSQQELVQQQVNPFETIGLMESQSLEMDEFDFDEPDSLFPIEPQMKQRNVTPKDSNTAV